MRTKSERQTIIAATLAYVTTYEGLVARQEPHARDWAHTEADKAARDCGMNHDAAWRRANDSDELVAAVLASDHEAGR